MGMVLVSVYVLLFIAQAAAYFQLLLGVGCVGALALAFLASAFVPMGAPALSTLRLPRVRG
jgi:hypothetical protein